MSILEALPNPPPPHIQTGLAQCFISYQLFVNDVIHLGCWKLLKFLGILPSKERMEDPVFTASAWWLGIRKSWHDSTWLKQGDRACLECLNSGTFSRICWVMPILLKPTHHATSVEIGSFILSLIGKILRDLRNVQWEDDLLSTCHWSVCIHSALWHMCTHIPQPFREIPSPTTCSVRLMWYC